MVKAADRAKSRRQRRRNLSTEPLPADTLDVTPSDGASSLYEAPTLRFGPAGDPPSAGADESIMAERQRSALNGPTIDQNATYAAPLDTPAAGRLREVEQMKTGHREVGPDFVSVPEHVPPTFAVHTART